MTSKNQFPKIMQFAVAGAVLCCIGGARQAAAQSFAPYIDMSITADENAVSMASASGVKAYTLAFLDADGACNLGWGGLGGALPTDNLANGTSMLTVVQQLKAAGVTPIFSIGGADGVDPAAYCSSASALQAAYQTAVTRYGITYLDFDIEGAATAQTAQIKLRDQALVGLKSANPGLVISYTIPTLPTGLVAGDGLNLLSSAKSDGVALSVVNIMTMDYGTSGTEMGSAATQAAAAVEGQIKSAGLSSTVGITPMIGQNDSAGEIFSLADASTVVNFAKANSYVSRLAMWSMGRDNGGCAGDTSASPSCSGISQATYAFSDVFEGFGGSTSGGGGGGGTGITGAHTLAPESVTGSRLDDNGGGTANGNKVDIWSNTSGNANEQWTISTTGVVPAGDYNLAVKGPYCLGRSGSTSGSATYIWACNGTSGESWNITADSAPTGYYQVKSTGGLCLGVKGGDSSTGNGTVVDIETCNSNHYQQWDIEGL